jgi:UDP-N-acetylmuramoylalanine--D-glutamate ligase
VEAPDYAPLVDAADVVLPGPGVRFRHPSIQLAMETGTPLWTELELAARWDDRPVVAVTGTNGKTTVTTLIAEMLSAAGRRVALAGNNDLPLVDALDHDVELFVVEASSFRLQFTETFRPDVACWLNFAEDHLDWHPSMEHYAAAKALIWRQQRPDDIAVVNVEDDEVMRWAASAPSTLTTFGLERGDVRIGSGRLVARGAEIAAVDDLPRRLTHDLANALAASACAIGAGVDPAVCGDVLRAFRGLPHRVALVGESGGVRWYDDSKATTPASVVAAVKAFPSVVLIAGGRNKGLDLTVLRDVGDRIRAVVAIGEAAPLVADVFAGVAPVTEAASMDDAVKRAADAAQAGDAVVLSPGCASYDWYRSYGERGDDFTRAVRELLGTAA